MENSIVRELNRLGVTQTKAAKEIGVARKHLNNIINGKVDPSVSIAARIASYFNKPIEAIFKLSVILLLAFALDTLSTADDIQVEFCNGQFDVVIYREETTTIHQWFPDGIYEKSVFTNF